MRLNIQFGLISENMLDPESASQFILITATRPRLSQTNQLTSSLKHENTQPVSWDSLGLMASKGTKTLARDASCPLPGLGWFRGRTGDRERNRGLSSAWLLPGVKRSEVEVTPRLEDGAEGASRSSFLTRKSITAGVLWGKVSVQSCLHIDDKAEDSRDKQPEIWTLQTIRQHKVLFVF